jgi:hypothetical protein
MAYSFQVTVDSQDPHVLADWWADAIGWQVEAQDEAFIREMVDAGRAGEDDTTRHHGKLVWKLGTAIVHPDDGPDAPDRRRVLFQLVPEAKVVKNRLHLDVRVGEDQIEAESERLVASGATFLHHGQQGPYRWITLADPEGNELCLT